MKLQKENNFNYRYTNKYLSWLHVILNSYGVIFISTTMCVACGGTTIGFQNITT